MKKLFILLWIIPALCNAQSVKISAMPRDAVLDSNDYFLENHQGTTTSKMPGITIMNYAYDVGDSVRSELADTATQLRSEIGGAAGWSKTAGHLYLTTISDSVGIGISTPLYKFHVVGDANFDSYVTIDTILVGDFGVSATSAFVGDATFYSRIYFEQLSWIDEVGTELWFRSPTAGSYTLSQLAASGDVSIYGTPATDEVAVWTDASTIKGTNVLRNIDTMYFDRTNCSIYRDATGIGINNPSSFRIDSTSNGNRVHGIASMQYTALGGIPTTRAAGELWYESTDTTFHWWTGYNEYTIGTGSGNATVSSVESVHNLAIFDGPTSIRGTDSVRWSMSDATKPFFGITGGKLALSFATNNVIIGSAAGNDMTLAGGAANNTWVGYQSGYNTTSNDQNTGLGSQAGYNMTANGGVFLGYQSGYNNTTANVLYIENSNASKFDALIWGDFANDSLRLNGKVRIEDSLYLDKFGTHADIKWAVITQGNAIDSGYAPPADFVIRYENKIPSFKDYYLDVIGDERLWYRGYNNGKWVTSRGMKSDGPIAITQLQAKSEMQDKWMWDIYRLMEAKDQEILRLTNRISDLEEQMRFIADEMKLLKKIR